MKYPKIIYTLPLSVFLLLSLEKVNVNAQSTVTFNYTGAAQTWTVPCGVTSITVTLYGASGGYGGDGTYGNVNPGGLGGIVEGTYTTSAGTVLNIYVGGVGQNQQVVTYGLGGFNGGGHGGYDGPTWIGGGGGGASDIRVGGIALANRIAVAGAGGGGGDNSNSPNLERGGPGGSTTAANGAGYYNGTQDGATAYCGQGATVATFGAGATSCVGSVAALGIGGNSCNATSGGGGGGGYYGGGCGCYAGAGGGSSYTGGLTSIITNTEGTAPVGNGLITITYTGLVITPSVISNVTCPGGSNGSASVAVVGGATPYTYAWNPSGQTNSTATGLTAGIYSITVTDNNGCTSTATATITQPAVLGVVASTITNVQCNGGNNGSAHATISGGAAAYTYAWTPSGGTNSTATGLTAGTYTITVQDACGETATSSTTITQPIILSGVIATVIQNVSCMGGNNGSISASITGGGMPYTYAWNPSGQTTQTATGLTAGTYTITVNDACGATATSSATVTQPATLLAVSASTTANELCNGENIGSTASTVSGGGTPYTYSWTPSGGTNSTATGLSAGTYTLSVTDAYGCSMSSSTTITQPTILATLAFTSTNVSCFGGSDGSTSSFTSGGTGAYTYSWAPSGGTQGTANGLTAGTYTLNVTDMNGCTASASTVITQPAAPLAVILNITSYIPCYGGNSGSIASFPSGGTAAYTYLWAPSGGTNSSASGLTAGSYTLTVTDNHGCSTTASASITQPGQIFVTLNATANETCRGAFQGSASSSISGGSAPFAYSWTGGAGHTDTATGLTAGTYTLSVRDVNGCTGSSSVTITEPPVLITSAAVTANVNCNQGNTGSASATPSGGTPPYTYAWFPSGGNNINASGLSAGSYTVTVNDNCEGVATASITITQTTAISVSATPTAHVLCNGGTDGSTSSATSGGTPPYAYSWSGGATNSSASALSAGTYTLNVTDMNGCTSSAETTITQPTAISIVQNAIPDNGKCTGSAWVEVSGGVSPYTYSWANGNTTYLDPNLCKGSYCCKVTDADGCKDSVCISVKSTLGIDGITAASAQIKVYPNPNNGQFTIQSADNEGLVLVEIYNVLGEEIYGTTFTTYKGSNNTINIGNQPNGIYLYRVITQTGNLLGEGKIIVQK